VIPLMIVILSLTGLEVVALMKKSTGEAIINMCHSFADLKWRCHFILIHLVGTRAHKLGPIPHMMMNILFLDVSVALLVKVLTPI